MVLAGNGRRRPKVNMLWLDLRAPVDLLASERRLRGVRAIDRGLRHQDAAGTMGASCTARRSPALIALD